MTEQAHHEDKLVGEWETRDSALKFEALVQLVTSLLTSGTVDDLDDTSMTRPAVGGHHDVASSWSTITPSRRVFRRPLKD